MRSRPFLGVATLVAVLGLAGCSPTSGHSRLGLARNGLDSFAQDSVGIGQPVTVLAQSVCTDGSPVRIEAVRLAGSKNLKLVDWGQRWGNGSRAGQPGIATDLKQDWTHEPVDARCTSKYPDAFVVSVERTGPETGLARGLTIRYAGGSLFMRDAIALCSRACTDEETRAAGG